MENEKRLIDANDLWQKTFVCDEVAEVRKFIEQAPTVDAVEVVRCDECTKSGCCIIEERLVTARAKDRYCGLGERKENG